MGCVEFSRPAERRDGEGGDGTWGEGDVMLDEETRNVVVALVDRGDGEAGVGGVDDGAMGCVGRAARGDEDPGWVDERNLDVRGEGGVCGTREPDTLRLLAGGLVTGGGCCGGCKACIYLVTNDGSVNPLLALMLVSPEAMLNTFEILCCSSFKN
jgi:hypothetical protein